MSAGVLPCAAELLAKARALFSVWGVADVLAHVNVRWHAPLRTAAGRADLRRGRIMLNPRLLARVPAEIGAVLTHEAAHLAAHALHGRRIRPHGVEWQALMRRAGAAPSRTHAYPVDGLGARRFWYLHVCASCGQRTVLRAIRRMRCVRCRERGEILVVRAPRTGAGLAALSALTHEQACGLPGRMAGS